MLCGYRRISDDPLNTMAGVDRQGSDIERLADMLEAEVCWHTDNDLSAFAEGVYRPAFEAMLAHVASATHPSRGILAYDLDRLCRRGDDLQRLLKLYRKDESLIFRTASAEINLSTTDGRLMAEVMVSFAHKESADKQRRLRSWHYHRALAGKPTGPVPFGWIDWHTLHPVEAPLLRQAAADIINGKSCEQIAREWNRAGVLPRARRRKQADGSMSEPVSSKWSSRTVGQVMEKPGMAGLAVYRRAVMLDPEGLPVRAQMVPMLELETWHKVCAVLASKPGSGRPKPDGRRYMATGTLRCAGCRRRLTAQTDNRVTGFNYLCHGAEGRGCGKTRIDGPSMDAYLNAWVEAALANVLPESVPVGQDPWPGEMQLAEARERHAEALAVYTGAKPSPFNRQTQVAMLQGLEATLEELRAEQARHHRAQAAQVRLAEASDLARWQAAYAAEDWDACRLTLDALLLEATVTPGGTPRGRRRNQAPVFDPARVELVAREPA